jgi:hypothetical protein
MLGEIASELGSKKANIRAIMGTTEGGRGVVRLVVDKHAAAKKAFASRGWETTEEEVFEATLADSPGSLGALGQKLGKSGVNVQYAYVGSAGSARRVSVFLGVSDVKAALKAAR